MNAKMNMKKILKCEELYECEEGAGNIPGEVHCQVEDY